MDSLVTSPSATSSSAGTEGKLASAFPWRALAAAAILILLGILWRWPTMDHLAQYDRFAFGHLAYSDVVKFFFTRDLASHQLPYLQQPFEYPVLTGLVIWLTALVPGIHGYFLANALLLSICLLASLVLLARLMPEGGLWRFALAPALVFYTVLNWDALVVLALVATLYLAERGRFLPAGATLAIGVSAKLFPILILPVLLAYAVRGVPFRRFPRSSELQPAIRLLAGFLAVLLAVNLPVALLNWRGWWYMVSFQTGRPVNPDAIWSHLPAVPASVSAHIEADIVVIGLVWLAYRVWKGESWQPAAMAALLLFLLCTRDYSPQYDLWLLPFLVLLACPLWLWLVVAAADALYYAAIFRWLAVFAAGAHRLGPLDPAGYLSAAVWTRELALAALLAWGLAQMRGMSLREWWLSLAAHREAAYPLRFGWRQALYLVAALRVGLGAVAMLSIQFQPVTFVQGDFTDRLIRGGAPWSELFSAWQRWDAFYYQVIATRGYRVDDGTTAFYPLYPLLSHVVSDLLIGNIVVAELLVSTAACFAAFWLLYRLARLDVSPVAALITVLLIACSPVGFFLLAPYTESLFLLLTVAAFWFTRRRQYWLAGAAGFLAGLTRLQAYFLVPALAWIILRRRDDEGRRSNLALLAAAMPAVGVMAFTVYLRVVVHEMRSSLNIQSAWGYQVVPPWQALSASWSFIQHPFDPTLGPIEILNLVALLGCAALIVVGLRRLPLSYVLYSVPYLGLLFCREMGYTPLMSVDRFTLVLFPCFLVLAIWLQRRPWLAGSWLAVGLMLQVLLLDRFVHFGFVG